MQDVLRWVAVYGELLAAKAEVLDTLLQRMQSAEHPEVQVELEGTQTLLLGEIERAQDRLRHWHDRELAVRRRQQADGR